MHTPETRERELQKRHRRRENWLKEKGPCQRCGSELNLECHHKDPKQKISHSVWSWSAARREAELSKCEVLCIDCHRAVTTELQWPGHGHIGTYKRGCRCDKCKRRKAVENSKRKR
jgi:hypothetical protein